MQHVIPRCEIGREAFAKVHHCGMARLCPRFKGREQIAVFVVKAGAGNCVRERDYTGLLGYVCDGGYKGGDVVIGFDG
jgi:hypothetical protein